VYGYLPGALRLPSLSRPWGTVACRCAYRILHQLCWVRTPKAAIEALLSCRVVVWLLPRNQTPFSLSNPYTGQPTFDELFRSAFIQTYVCAGSATARLDVWRCRGFPSASKVARVVSKNGLHGERSLSAEHLVTMEAKGRVGYGRQRVPHRAAIRICKAPGQDILSSRRPAVLSAIDR
jgi:hypothetical protein